MRLTSVANKKQKSKVEIYNIQLQFLLNFSVNILLFMVFKNLSSFFLNIPQKCKYNQITEN